MIRLYVMLLGGVLFFASPLCAVINLVPISAARLVTELQAAKSTGTITQADFSNAQETSDVLAAVRKRILNGKLVLPAGWTGQTLGVSAPKPPAPNAIPVRSRGTLNLSVSVGNTVYQTTISEGLSVSLPHVK